MVEAITSGLTSLLGWIGSFLNELLTTGGDLNALLVLVGLACAFSVVKFGIHIIRSFAFGF